MKHRPLIIALAIILALVLFVAAEFLIAKYNGPASVTPEIPREPEVLGSGPSLTYVVMGDSTSIGEGTDYSHSYAVASANHLANSYRINFINVGVSGAITRTVVTQQLAKAEKYKPDLVLLGVGANDAKSFVSGHNIQINLRQIIIGLRQANPKVRIVVTGSPAMDVTRRFPPPLRQFMRLRTTQVNNAFAPIIKQYNLTFAPIATKTRAAFLADPTLLAADKFHPDARGYALWTPVINKALDEALKTPAH